MRSKLELRLNLAVLTSMIFALAVLATARPVACQTTEAEVTARLKGVPLYLRGMWAEDKLAFDADGAPTGTYRPLPFTEAGVEVHSVKLKSDHLQIDGQRVGLEFDDKGRMKRAPLKKIRIDIASAAAAGYGKALDAIFAPSLASLQLPSYWQSYAQRYFLETGVIPFSTAETNQGSASAAKDKDVPGAPLHIGGVVKPPKLLSQIEPSYTSAARELKFSANVQLYLWLLEDGSVSHVHVARPAGLGLDENAIAAVMQYKFAPATKDGKPVKVDLYIDVNFQIF